VRTVKGRPDEGVGIVEVLIAMAIFGLIMASTAPLFLSAVKSQAKSANVASASQIANQQLERARSAATSCAALKSHLATSSAGAERTDSRGLHFAVSETNPSTITCPAPGGLIDYQVVVTAQVPGKPVTSTLKTQIWVSG